MSSKIPSVESVVSEAEKQFFAKFPEHRGAQLVKVVAPGRVNLIGEHTDYNDGFVLPMALPMVTCVVGLKTKSNKCRLMTMSETADAPHISEFNIPSDQTPLKPGLPKWANYPKGVVANFKGSLLCGFDGVMNSSVPLGGGLSSSAAVEVAMYTFLEEITTCKATSFEEKALACVAAEHEFPGMPCGIMDQFISVMGKQGHALLIDCRSQECSLVGLEDPGVSVLIINSNVKHELTGTEYSTRRTQCHQAAATLHKPSLREAHINTLEANRSQISKEIYHRARHVISEISRTQKAVKALKQADFVTFGALMTESHVSLRDDYEVSCVELDALVESALQVDGVYGSRMTGGGFGGCTVSLVASDAVECVIEHVGKNYKGTATFYVCKAAQGARVV